MKATRISPTAGPAAALAGSRQTRSHPSRIRKIRFLPLIGLACLALGATPAQAQISVVNTSSLNDATNATSYTLSFDAGNGGTADKLIVSAGAEGAVAVTGITYNGVALTFIPNTGHPATGRNRGIWYLDNPFAGGPADIVVSGDGVTSFSHIRLGVASIAGSAPGAAIGNLAAAGSVDLNVPDDDSFVFAAYAGNLSNPASAAATPLVPIFGVNGDSANMAAGYENPAPAGPVTYSFTSLNSPETSAAAFVPTEASPVIVATTPADNEIEAPVATDLVATFSEPVVAGTGTIELWQTGGGAPVESFDVATSPRLTFSGQTLTIDPTANLTPGVEYYLLIPTTAVVDTTGGNAFAGISDPTTWSFTGDGLPPIIVSRIPADDAPNARVAANLVATFNEPVIAGTGSIELWQEGGVSPIESFDVANPTQITLTGATLGIDPTADLLPGTTYHVTIPATAILDASGNPFAGPAGETEWNFTTRATATEITVVNTNNGFVQTNPPPARTWSFDAGPTADMLIIAYSGEVGQPAGVTVTNSAVQITYAGFPMTRAIGGVNAAVFYLDLTTTPYAGGAADLVVDLSDYGSRNGLGIGAVSINSGEKPLVLHKTANGGANSQSVTLKTTIAGAFAVASFNSNNSSGTPAPAVSAPLTQIYASNNIGSARGGAGYEADVAPGEHSYTWTLPTTNATPRSAVAASFVIASAGGDSFADWIADPAYGIDPEHQGLGDDPDGDGIANGVENFFGTHPGEFSQGLLAGTNSGNTFTFTHPQGATPASDLTPAYRWSTDLINWYAGDNVDGPGGGLTVGIVADPVGPPTTTVTATASQAVSTLFLRVE
ncbi:MAG: Ig-like domain-containing protein, partial [Akkermansiaceae bacterium]|nr:Ig-like domain-containing protein [Akkermansiaceae bacterium]